MGMGSAHSPAFRARSDAPSGHPEAGATKRTVQPDNQSELRVQAHRSRFQSAAKLNLIVSSLSPARTDFISGNTRSRDL